MTCLSFGRGPNGPDWRLLDRDGKLWGMLSALRPLSIERDGLYCARDPIVAARYREQLRPGTFKMQLSVQFDRKRLGIEGEGTIGSPEASHDGGRDS